MKQLISLFLLAGLFFSASAQQQDAKYKVSVGGELMSAFGSTAEFYNIGYGASLQGEYALSPKLSATLSGAYVVQTLNKVYEQIFLPWTNTLGDKMFYIAKAGAKYDFYKKFYVSAEGGAAISKDKVARGNSFAYAGGLGTRFAVSSKTSIDVGVRFEEWAVTSTDRLSFVGLRAAYAFGF